MKLSGSYIFIIALACVVMSLSCSADNKKGFAGQAEDVLREQILAEAQWAMEQQPQTVTSFVCERSAGGAHDFYSEGDYWWPNPEDPEGPYIRRDGETNPDNFVAHRIAMIRFSRIVGSLASAYIITGNEDYVRHAFLHIAAWFTDPQTMMNPDLAYAQAIKGITTGRGIGIIDTIHLMEVAQGIIRMAGASCVDGDILAGTKKWFADYTTWLTTSQNGLDEMNTTNNHATCWIMQVASFARLTGNEEVLEFCRNRFKSIIVPDQMAADGSFPREINRTKPYGYSLFNLDAMVTAGIILSTPQDDIWEYTTEGGRNLKLALEFMYPYIEDKSAWPYGQDVMYWDDWPVAHPALLFGAAAYDEGKYFELWKRLPHAIAAGEVERNVPIRNPMIWL